MLEGRYRINIFQAVIAIWLNASQKSWFWVGFGMNWSMEPREWATPQRAFQNTPSQFVFILYSVGQVNYSCTNKNAHHLVWVVDALLSFTCLRTLLRRTFCIYVYRTLRESNTSVYCVGRQSFNQPPPGLVCQLIAH